MYIAGKHNRLSIEYCVNVPMVMTNDQVGYIFIKNIISIFHLGRDIYLTFFSKKSKQMNTLIAYK